MTGILKVELGLSLKPGKGGPVAVCVHITKLDIRTCQSMRHGDYLYLSEIFHVRRNDRLKVFIRGANRIMRIAEYNRLRFFYIS